MVPTFSKPLITQSGLYLSNEVGSCQPGQTYDDQSSWHFLSRKWSDQKFHQNPLPVYQKNIGLKRIKRHILQNPHTSGPSSFGPFNWLTKDLLPCRLGGFSPNGKGPEKWCKEFSWNPPHLTLVSNLLCFGCYHQSIQTETFIWKITDISQT